MVAVNVAFAPSAIRTLPSPPCPRPPSGDPAAGPVHRSVGQEAVPRAARPPQGHWRYRTDVPLRGRHQEEDAAPLPHRNASLPWSASSTPTDVATTSLVIGRRPRRPRLRRGRRVLHEFVPVGFGHVGHVAVEGVQAVRLVHLIGRGLLVPLYPARGVACCHQISLRTRGCS